MFLLQPSTGFCWASECLYTEASLPYPRKGPCSWNRFLQKGGPITPAPLLYSVGMPGFLTGPLEYLDRLSDSPTAGTSKAAYDLQEAQGLLTLRRLFSPQSQRVFTVSSVPSEPLRGCSRPVAENHQDMLQGYGLGLGEFHCFCQSTQSLAGSISVLGEGRIVYPGCRVRGS